MTITYREEKDLPRDAVLNLYATNNWSSAKKPDQLLAAIQNSHSVMTAWHGDSLVGLANAISDGFLVVYYPHVLVLPDFQRRGIGQELMSRLMQGYKNFHQHCVLSDKSAVPFYEACGMTASSCTAMWIYDGRDH